MHPSPGTRTRPTSGPPGFPTKREAEAYEGEVQRGQYRGTQPIEAHTAKTLFAEYAEEWLASAVDLRPKTAGRYRCARTGKPR